MPKWTRLENFKFRTPHDDLKVKRVRPTFYDLTGVSETEEIDKRNYYQLVAGVNLERCIRLCLLSTQCDMVEYWKNGQWCTMFPNQPLKSVNIHEVVVKASANDYYDVYILHCSGGQENLIVNNDPFTHSRDRKQRFNQF